MLLNVAVDMAIGAIPFFGDVGDFVFKSNRKNLELLKKHSHGAVPPSAVDRAVLLGAVLLVLITLGLAVWVAWWAFRWLLGHPI